MRLFIYHFESHIVRLTPRYVVAADEESAAEYLEDVVGDAVVNYYIDFVYPVDSGVVFPLP